MPPILASLINGIPTLEYNLPAYNKYMKGISKAINDFITEFDLTATAEGVCFDALLFIYTKYLAAQVESEVHIVSIGSECIDTIQILNPSLGIEAFPSRFEAGYVDISYQPQKGLIIRGSALHFGEYKLVIHPVKNDCKTSTVEEIKARYYN